jgi:N-acetylglucosaminyldiphosphoundecaprenol N-acetyl-beta-D-mannosaminyltransferase
VTERIYLAKIPTDLFSISSLHNLIGNVIECNQKKIFLHSNSHLIKLSNSTDKWLIEFFNDNSNAVMCDGSGIEFGAKLTNQVVPPKIPYNTWIWDFANYLAENGYSLFLLGADEKTICKASENLIKHNSNLNIVDYHNGYFDKNKNSSENRKVLNLINQYKPNVLLVGFGMPTQEKWVKENKNELEVNAIFTCGGAFDFISGSKPVAPSIIRKLHIEFLFRTLLEPRRLFKRNIIDNFYFIYYVITEHFRKDKS